jgi:hypothetical protein
MPPFADRVRVRRCLAAALALLAVILLGRKLRIRYPGNGWPGRPKVEVGRDELRRALGLRPCDPTPRDPTAAVAAVNDAERIAEAEELAWLNLDAGES